MDDKLIEKLPIVEKGWQILLTSIEEGYLYDDITCRAKTRSKAKSILLNKSEVLGMQNRWGDDISYLNIPVVRCKEIDLIEYNGEIISRTAIKWNIKKEKHKKELTEILENPNITHCYIKKRGLYYRDNYCGYVEERLGAGIYTKKEACYHADGCLELTVIPIDTKEHNDYINNHINKLKNRIIL